MADSELKSKVIKGTFWTLLEKFSKQIVLFVVGIVLARLLSPTDYGTVAMLDIFTAVASVLANSGLGAALVQKKDVDELDFNSVFYTFITFACVLYGVLFCIAPAVARFYEIPELKSIMRVVSLSLIFNAINSVQGAVLYRSMRFHLNFRLSLIGTVTSGVSGITLAYLGFGVWALVWAAVISDIVGVIARWWMIGWRPRLQFSYERLKPLWSYGWKMMSSELLNTFFGNLHSLIIGKYYSRADLSFVNKGGHLPKMVISNVDGTLGTVSFPALCKLQNDKIKLREAMRRMMVVSTFFVFPLMALAGCTSYRTILFLYGEKWLPCVPFAQIACFRLAMMPFHTINLRGIQALGRSDVFLKLEVIKKILSITVLIVGLSQGVLFWCLLLAFVSGPLSVIINSWPNRKLLDYSLKMQIMDILPAAVVAIMGALPLVGINLLALPDSPLALFLILAGQGVFYVIFYLVIAFAFKLRGVREVAMMMKSTSFAQMPLMARIFNYLGV